jgi:hypothetical protein
MDENNVERSGVIFRDSDGKEYFFVQEGDAICIRQGRRGTSVLLGYKHIDEEFARIGGVLERIEDWMDRNKRQRIDVVKMSYRVRNF